MLLSSEESLSLIPIKHRWGCPDEQVSREIHNCVGFWAFYDNAPIGIPGNRAMFSEQSSSGIPKQPAEIIIPLLDWAAESVKGNVAHMVGLDQIVGPARLSQVLNCPSERWEKTVCYVG